MTNYILTAAPSESSIPISCFFASVPFILPKKVNMMDLAETISPAEFRSTPPKSCWKSFSTRNRPLSNGTKKKTFLKVYSDIDVDTIYLGLHTYRTIGSLKAGQIIFK